MDVKPNILLPQGSDMYDENLSSKLKSLFIPEKIFLKSSSDFDDKHINNEGDKWVFIIQEVSGTYILSLMT